MGMVYNIIVIIQVLSALAIIGLVLVQHGKGADMGAAFGSGASGSLFGATGSSNFLSKSTAIAAAVFFCSTLIMAYIGHKRSPVESGVMENIQTVPSSAAPAAPSAPSAAPAPSNSSVPGDFSGTSKQAGQIPK